MEVSRESFPYAVKSGLVYRFGIPNIDEKKQLQLLEEAAKTLDGKNTEVVDYYSRFETPKKSFNRVAFDAVTRPPGYCKSTDCKQHNPPKHAACYGNHAIYHCAPCMARMLCNARFNSTGPSVRIEVDTHGESPKAPNEALEVSFAGGKILINNQIVEARWEYMENGPDDCCKYKLLVNGPLQLGKQIICGSFVGHIKGRFVCKNLALGKKCLSVEPGYKPQGFMANTVLPGMPGWREEKNDDPHRNGKIVIYEYCPACAIQANHEKNSWAKKSPKTPMLPEESGADKELKTLILNLREQLIKLQTDNTKLREMLAQRDEENADLRRKNAKYEADQLAKILTACATLK